MMGCLIVHFTFTCLLSAALLVHAWHLPNLQIQSITAARSRTILKAAHQSHLLEFFQKKNKDNTINSVEDFDQDLAAEIEDALLSAGVTGRLSSVTASPPDEQPTISAASSVSESTSSDESSEKQILHQPIQIKAPKIDMTPPHTSLAQVMANQLNIDLSFVTPSNAKKITAADVEYHAWKMSQPPCTPEALARAHQTGLDLNALYDDDGREYVIQLSDVQLYEGNCRSLRLVSQKRRGAPKNDVNPKTEQRTKKLSAIDERMEKRMEVLVKKLGNVAGGIAKTVKLQTSEGLVNIENEDESEIKSVEDFDAALAVEIQDALMTADLDYENNSHQIGSTKSLQSIEDVAADEDAKPIPDIKSVQDSDATLAFEIRTDSNSENNSHGKMFEPDKPPQSIYDIESDANNELGTIQSASDIGSGTEVELQTIHKSMTAAEIKEHLRAHGVKSCGKKSELAQRLHTLKILQSMTVEQLKQDLREQGLKVGGKKAELVERLIYAKENEKKTDGSLFFVHMQ